MVSKIKRVRKEQIDNFLDQKNIAIAGASRNPKKFGHIIFKELAEKGYTVLPVNPFAENIDGVSCYKSVEDLPEDTESLLIITPKEQTDGILRSAIKKGIKNIWVQQMSNTEETLKIAEEYQKEIITGKCIFMFAEPINGFHKFHRTLTKIFGGLPA